MTVDEMEEMLEEGNLAVFTKGVCFYFSSTAYPYYNRPLDN